MFFAALLNFAVLNINIPANINKPCPVPIYEAHADCTVIDNIVECEYTDLKTGEKTYTVCADGVCIEFSRF